MSAVCPVCASMPWSDSSHAARDFLSHLRVRHQFDYSEVADFDADEEAMLRRALSSSALEAGVDEEEDLQRILRETGLEAAGNAGDDDDDEDGEIDSGDEMDHRGGRDISENHQHENSAKDDDDGSPEEGEFVRHSLQPCNSGTWGSAEEAEAATA